MTKFINIVKVAVINSHQFDLMELKKDKSKNLAFCIECYKKGQLKEPDLTEEDFIKRKKEEIKKFNWLTRWILLLRFKNLERWNKNSYF